MTDAVVLSLAGLIGLALGSFLNVCVARWPRGWSVVRPRSACPACSATIRWYDQIPVVSWFLLRGRCRKCGARLSLCYPLVETAGAAIWVLAVLTRGVSLDAVAAAFFLLVLLGIALTDARFYLIPHQFSLGGAAVGLALSLAPGGITPGDAAAGAAVGFGGMWLVGTAGTWLLARVRPGRLEAAGREHDEGRRRARDARGVRVLARPRGQLAALLPALPVMVLAGWWFGPVGVAAAVAAGAFGLAVLVAWVEGLGEHADAAAPASPVAALGGGDVRMMALVGGVHRSVGRGADRIPRGSRGSPGLPQAPPAAGNPPTGSPRRVPGGRRRHRSLVGRSAARLVSAAVRAHLRPSSSMYRRDSRT